jgi:hypothetical protein
MTDRTLNEAGVKFKFRENISIERKIKIEKHPQCKDYFRFRKSGNMGNCWKWFVRTTSHNSKESKYFKKDRFINK